jgi:hypothetical protein
MSTIIRLLPAQVPQLWEVIKLAAVRSQEVPDAIVSQVCERLLHGLLSDTVQCSVTLDEQRTILQICLTKVQIHQMTGVRELVITGLYSFRLMEEADIQASKATFLGMARSQHCSQIVCASRNPRLWKVYESLGFQESHRSYVYLMEGS